MESISDSITIDDFFKFCPKACKKVDFIDFKMNSAEEGFILDNSNTICKNCINEAKNIC